MKKLAMMVLLAVLMVNLAQANEMILECSRNELAYDGPLKTLTIEKSSDQGFGLRLYIKPSGMSGNPIKEYVFQDAYCELSEKNLGVAECEERRSNGFRGLHTLNVMKALSEGNDIFRVMLVRPGKTQDEIVEMTDFRVNDCKVLGRE